MMERRISKAFLYGGSDLSLGEQFRLHHPKVGEILTLGQGFLCEAYYWTYVHTLASDPYDHMVWLDDQGIDYEAVTRFDVFVLRWIDAMKQSADDPSGTAASARIYSDALSFFLGPRSYQLASRGGQFWIYDMEHPDWTMGKEAYQWVSDWVEQINLIDRSGQIHPATPGAKRILIEDTRDEEKRARRKQKRRPSSPPELIGDAMAAVLNGGSGGISPFNIRELSIYALLSASVSTHRKMRVGAMLNGIYTGMLPADKLAADDLRWT